MKFLLAITILTVPSLVFAQGLTKNDGFDSERRVEYRSDPFTVSLLKVENPCNDKRYLEVRNKRQEELSYSEFATVEHKDEACREYLNQIKEPGAAKYPEDPNHGEAQNLKPYYWVGGVCITIISIVIVFNN